MFFCWARGQPPPPKETFVTMYNFLFIRFMSFFSGQASLCQFNKLISLCFISNWSTEKRPAQHWFRAAQVDFEMLTFKHCIIIVYNQGILLKLWMVEFFHRYDFWVNVLRGNSDGYTNYLRWASRPQSRICLSYKAASSSVICISSPMTKLTESLHLFKRTKPEHSQPLRSLREIKTKQLAPWIIRLNIRIIYALWGNWRLCTPNVT